ncbi:CsbD family protein [Ahrensia sp. R2A130]|uniref:CsbD family protein n=1 Tax=Ahrensia sp. R2A130 TaxID=744979 RepID=UPI0001E09465|nr:CsbD family protein [Ahrensia sp. R2A130]EFL88546.1 CsbD family protein [Ahrensia sp. R2A130]
MANTDQSEGMGKKIVGTIKEAVGKVTGDKETEAEGQVDQAEGEVQKTWGDVKDKL